MVTRDITFAEMLQDFRRAVAQDCMGWYCERYSLGPLEIEAGTSVDLIAFVAVWLASQEKIYRQLENTPIKSVQDVAPYGYCPTCSDIVLRRERRPDGNDTCKNGHVYPSRLSQMEPSA